MAGTETPVFMRLPNHAEARVDGAVGNGFAVMGFDIEMVVTQTAGQGNIADILDGFDIHAVIGFGRVGQAVSAYQTLQGRHRCWCIANSGRHEV